MSELDYSGFKDGPGDNLLAQISATAAEQKQAELEVAQLQEKLQAASENLKRISEIELPKLMDLAEMTSFTTKEGIKVSCLEKIRASIPATRRGEAFGWLEDNGHENIIKRQFIIEFSRDQEEWAKQFEKTLDEDLNVTRKKDVHNSTLVAFLKEQLSEGVAIPLDVFGAYRQRYSKIE